MARIDSLLSILLQQAADELRLGTDREPQMLAHGVPKRLSIPSTPEDTLRALLGEILGPEREAAMHTQGRLEVTYEAAGLGAFHVKMTPRNGGFDVVFRRAAATRAAAPATAPGPNAAPAPAAAAVPLNGSRPAAPQASPPDTEPAARAEASASLFSLLAAALAFRASDLHLADGALPVVRVDGALRTLSDAPVDLLAMLALGPGREERLARGLSLDMGVDAPEGVRARLHVFRTHEGIAASIRLLPSAAPSLASLHLPVPLDDLLDLPHGLVLVCGATGSGKSTTLAALAQEALRRRSIVLTTLEDPIEYAMTPSSRSLVRRREIGADVADFPTGLRDALREDPDVLLVGEMRDTASIGLALTAAETGHLVLSSLHSRSAASAIERIVDSYPPERQLQARSQLADSLRAVVAQRLVPRARGSGRLPCLEVLRVTHAVAALIRDGRTALIPNAIQAGGREGMLALERSLAERVQAGEIRLEDARAVANEQASLASYLGRSGD